MVGSGPLGSPYNAVGGVPFTSIESVAYWKPLLLIFNGVDIHDR